VTVTDIVTSDMMTAAHGVANSMSMGSVSRKAMSAQAMATPPMANATMSGKPMVSTASAMPAATPAMKPGKSTAPAVKATASTAPAVKATASAPTAMSPAATAPMPAGDCRDVGDEAKRANRNARCQNAYRPLHGALSLIEVGSNAREPTHLNVTVVSAASFIDGEAKVPR
jgi:hypothetical protein